MESPSLPFRHAEPPPPDLGGALISALRPLGAAEVVDAAIQLLRQGIRPLMVLAAVAAAGRILLLVVQVQMYEALRPSGGPSAPQLALVFATMAPLAAWHVMVSASLVCAASDLMLGRDVDPGAALRLAFSRAFTLLYATVEVYLRAGLVLVASTLVAVLPVLLYSLDGGVAMVVVGGAGALFAGAATLAFMARYAVRVPAVVVEGHSAREALRRSAALTAGSRQRVFVLQFLLFAIGFVATGGTTYALSALVRDTLLVSILNTVLWLPLAAVGPCVIAVLYYELRMRHEGFDIELMAGRLAPHPPPAAPSARVAV